MGETSTRPGLKLLMDDKVVLNARALANKALARSQAQKRQELTGRLKDGQLALWRESERGIPNELVRCAVFSAKNRNEPRKIYRANAPYVIELIGPGQIIYTGEELRQDDETVWLQLVHMAKEARSETITFTPYSLLKTLKWPGGGDSYKRLLATLRRLMGTVLEVYSERLDKGVTTNLIANFEYAKDHDKPWRVKVFDEDDELLFLFDKLHYSRLDWDMRLALPTGIATWLHGYLASHKKPYPIYVDTLAKNAGLTLETPEDKQLDKAAQIAKRKKRLNEAKRAIKKALEALREREFLKSFEITKEGLVSVIRNN